MKQRLRSVPRLFWLALLGALLLHLAIRILLWERGFVSVSADEFSRGLRSAKWGADPVLKLRHFTAAWLPLEMYLNGALLRIWDNPFWVPRVTVFITSYAALLSVVGFNFTLFGSYTAAAVNAYFLVLFQWFAWLSATPMLEMYYLPFYMLGLLFLLRFVRDRMERAWFFSGLGFLLATSVHVQSWLIVATTLTCTLPFSLRSVLQRDWLQVRRWVGLYGLAVGFVAFAVFAQWRVRGVALGFLSKHTAYSLWYYDGYDVSLVEKLLYYARIVVEQMPLFLWPLVLMALVLLLGRPMPLLRLSPLFLSIMLLVIFGVSNVNSGPPSAAPNRYSLLHVSILLLYAAYGFAAILQAARARAGFKRASLIGLAVGLTVVLGVQQLRQIAQFPRGMPPEPVLAGAAVGDLLETEGAGKVLLELTFWEFLAVEMMINSAESIHYDREYNLTQRDLPSELLSAETTPATYLAHNQIRYVAVRSTELKDRIATTAATVQWQRGDWIVYSLDEP